MNGEPGALVIHCSDPRYQGAFHDFLRNDLRLDRYALIAVPGGPQCLTAAEYLPKFSWAGWRWVKFIDKLGCAERVILIAHEDCRWYEEMGLALDAPARERQMKDLRAASAELRERYGSGRVELFYASLVGTRAKFQAL